MAVISKLKSHLWRPFEVLSCHPPEKIERDLSGHVIKEPTFHLLPYYGKLTGEVGDGKFKIRFEPQSALFTRGAGRLTVRGKIELDGRGSRIHGNLPGPPFATWLLLGLALWASAYGLIQFLLTSLKFRHDSATLSLDFFISAVFFGFAAMIFAFDRSANKEGESKILAVLDGVAK